MCTAQNKGRHRAQLEKISNRTYINKECKDITHSNSSTLISYCSPVERFFTPTIPFCHSSAPTNTSLAAFTRFARLNTLHIFVKALKAALLKGYTFERNLINWQSNQTISAACFPRPNQHFVPFPSVW